VTAVPEQLTLADMPARLFACTPSRLAAHDCPRRYRFGYLDRPPPARGRARAHNTLGAVVHLALHQWWLLPRSRRSPEAGARLVEHNWQPGSAGGFRDDAQSVQWRDVAAGWVRQYLDEQVDADDEPVAVERTVATGSTRLAISGRVDRIDERAGELVVVDYKTGRSMLDDDDARGSQALALYVLGVRRTLRRKCRRVELHHLPSGRVAAFEHTDESLAGHVARAEQTAADIVAASDAVAAGADPDDAFPPRPGPACRWCDFRSICPAGQAARPEPDPWAGLANLEN
jgi:putative RecB family exonuclease